MENAFWDLVASVKALTLNIGDKQAITKKATKLHDQLKRIDPIEHIAFKNQHSLIAIKERSIHDKLFNILKMPKNSPQQITLVFEEFIKGLPLTYFNQQKKHDIHQPIYHRLASCGDGSKTFREAFNICTNETIKEKRKVKKIIERCYIERLIYNDLYTHQTIHDEQDEEHLHWLEQTKHDFHTCFPRLDIKVTIEEYDGVFPIKLRIEKYRSNKLVYEETYQKELIHGPIPQYENLVVVTRNQKHTRIQVF